MGGLFLVYKTLIIIYCIRYIETETKKGVVSNDDESIVLSVRAKK